MISGAVMEPANGRAFDGDDRRLALEARNSDRTMVKVSEVRLDPG
jgi:hypothetical protein